MNFDFEIPPFPQEHKLRPAIFSPAVFFVTMRLIEFGISVGLIFGELV